MSESPTARSGAGDGRWWRRLARDAAAWMRWLHLYLSMASFAILLFFAVTGITLNHPDWFPVDERSEAIEGEAPAALVGPPDSSPDVEALAAWLRARHALSGRLGEVRSDEFECEMPFHGPGYSADVVIDRATGKYRGEVVRFGVVAVMNDLHKGRDSGPGWSIVIDVSAVAMIAVSLTGLGLLWFIKRRLVWGLIVTGLGAVASCGAYAALVR